jgi:hypothetical protein
MSWSEPGRANCGSDFMPTKSHRFVAIASVTRAHFEALSDILRLGGSSANNTNVCGPWDKWSCSENHPGPLFEVRSEISGPPFEVRSEISGSTVRGLGRQIPRCLRLGRQIPRCLRLGRQISGTSNVGPSNIDGWQRTSNVDPSVINHASLERKIFKEIRAFALHPDGEVRLRPGEL